ncbi:MAG TPA: L-glutamate gamma-semialdehyde dehydrogenase [Sphingomonas sp.]
MTAMFGILASTDARNERVRDHAPGSPERASLRATLDTMARERIALPLVIAGREIETGVLEPAIMPHDHAHILADAHLAGATETAQAIAAAKAAWHDWSRTPWEARARIFLKAADLVSGPWRDRLNAATMLGQSKTVYQAEIDSAAELADFLRFNVHFMLRLYGEQPISPDGVWNRVDYRPLEGFVYAVTPFNFTAIAGNLPTAPALMGNTVVWKPSATAKLSAHYVMAMLREAGLPDGVINLVYGDPVAITGAVLSDDALAGVHFTGSTAVFDQIVAETSRRRYRNYPRIVGETGGKNFTLAHPSADPAALAIAVIRGGYEYQGQKCSATSRLYVPRSLWRDLRDRLTATIEAIEPGDVRDFSRFMGAVIDERAWHRLDAARATAGASASETIVAGGKGSMATGFFVPPTLIETNDLGSAFLRTEFFGPLVTAFVFDDGDYDAMLDHLDRDSAYGLTGAVFARDASVVARSLDRLRHAAGNVYVNDKSTGAVVGQQPFGGARASGTNDKAGSMWNLARWVSPRTIKESFASPTDHRYPSMLPDA